MSYLNNLGLIVSLFIPLLIGIVVYKLKMVGKDFPKGLSAVLFNVTLPCSILVSMNFDASAEDILSASALHIICIVSMLFCYFAGKLVSRIIEKDKDIRPIIIYSLMFSNFTYSAYPILEGFYGPKAVFYASLFNIFTFVFNFTLGIAVMQKSGGGASGAKITWKSFVSPPFLAIFAGIFLLMFKIKLPSVLDSAIGALSNVTTPLSMLMIGMIIARENSFNLKDKNVYIISLLRLVVIPLLLLFVLKAIGFSDYMVYVPVIVIANPVAVNSALFTENYGGRSDIAANYIIVSSALSILTIPLIQLLI